MKTADNQRDHHLLTYGGLLIAVLAISWASIFVRWCDDTPALTIAFYRMFWSLPLFIILSTRRPVFFGRVTTLSNRERWLVFAAGFFLALHFATWITSLKYTMIAHALILSSTHPVFALILAPLILKEKGGWRGGIAVILTLVGIIIIGGKDFSFRSQQFRGDLLAVFSALFITLSLFIARHIRGKIDLLLYLLFVHTVAATILLGLNLVYGYELFRYSLKIHGVMLLLALIPTGIGHSLINWAAQRLEVYKVNISILGEPLLSSLLAYVFFRELPQGWFYPGAVFILLGLTLALADRKNP